MLGRLVQPRLRLCRSYSSLRSFFSSLSSSLCSTPSPSPTLLLAVLLVIGVLLLVLLLFLPFLLFALAFLLALLALGGLRPDAQIVPEAHDRGVREVPTLAGLGGGEVTLDLPGLISSSVRGCASARRPRRSRRRPVAAAAAPPPPPGRRQRSSPRAVRRASVRPHQRGGHTPVPPRPA